MVKVFREHYKDVDAFFTDRWGGVSQEPFHELNLALHVEDNPIAVLQNRQILADKANFYIDNLIYMDQTHSANISIIKNTLTNKIENCDGIITNQPNIPLMVMVADCIPVLLYDKNKKVIGAVHAGRNGTFLEIVKKAVSIMIENFNSSPKDIEVSLGPSIRSCCYEVGQDLADIEKKSFGQKYVIKRGDSFYLDLQSLNHDQLTSIGILKENIDISQTCTCCDKNYFSYRRDGKTGRFAGVIKLNG
jgi:YfiH family protein